MAQGNGGSHDPMTELRASVDELGNQVSRNNQAVADVQQQLNLMGPALAGLAGLDNIAGGIAQIVEVLAPLRTLGNPPMAADPEVEQAIADMKVALAQDLRLTVNQIPVTNLPIAFIGQV